MLKAHFMRMHRNCTHLQSPVDENAWRMLKPSRLFEAFLEDVHCVHCIIRL